MSGGSFNYAYTRVETFVEELEAKLRRAVGHPEEEGADDREQPPELSLDTLARLSEIAKLSAHVAKLMREAEYLYSQDTSEESFHANLAELAATMPPAPGRSASERGRE